MEHRDVLLKNFLQLVLLLDRLSLCCLCFFTFADGTP
jgi:hypothetical protein